MMQLMNKTEWKIVAVKAQTSQDFENRVNQAVSNFYEMVEQLLVEEEQQAYQVPFTKSELADWMVPVTLN
ncbi:hypothetical protein WDW89_11650 [Deltaproteobacteria bacterium TL4]